jgi:hypothetical protein
LGGQLARVSIQAVAVGLLERALAQGEPSDAALAAFQARLEAVEPEPVLLYGLRGERAGHSRFFENLRNGTVPLSMVTAPAGGWLDVDDAMLHVPGYIVSHQAFYLHRMNEAVEIAKLPSEQWSGRITAWAREIEEMAAAGKLPRLAAVFLGFVDRMFQSFQRHHATLRCAVVAVAAERYRRANGRWPAAPDELVTAGLLTALPGDPFAAGQSIKFATTVDGLIVYSVGQDGADGGGDLTKDSSGVGADHGVRLWDVAARRQPPKPAEALP